MKNYILAILTLVVHGNYARRGEDIVYLHDQLLQLAKPALQLVVSTMPVSRGGRGGGNINYI